MFENVTSEVMLQWVFPSPGLKDTAELRNWYFYELWILF